MPNLTLLQALRLAFAEPARRVSHYDRVDPKILPLVNTRYV